jgi:hypothetical protein
MNRIHIIGAGGIGGVIIQALSKSRKLIPEHYGVMIWDKDKVEDKNLDRQFFSKSDVGKYKSKSFGIKYDFEFVTEWFTERSGNIYDNDIIIVCADNNGARLSALNVADRKNGIGVIIGANEYIESQSYIYFKEWNDTSFDPRKYYPELLEHDIHDPTKEQCTGHVLEYTPQLAIANMMAGSFIMMLYYTWFIKLPSMRQQLSEREYEDVIRNTPKKLDCNSYSKVMYNNLREEIYA